MTKFMKMQIIWSSVVFVLILIIGFLGVYALQKSMTIKMGFNVEPNVRCVIEAQIDGGNYEEIFSNLSNNSSISPNWMLDTTHSSLIYRNNLSTMLGTPINFKIHNYTTKSIYVESIISGVTYDSKVVDALAEPRATASVEEVSAQIIDNSSTSFSLKFTQVNKITIGSPTIEFDMDYAQNTVKQAQNGYCVPIGTNLVGKLVSTTANASISISSITNAETYTFNENILTISSANITGNITISTNEYYIVTTNFEGVQFDTSYSSTLEENNGSYYIPVGEDLEAKLFTSENATIIINSPTPTHTFGNDNILTILSANITGNITISASGVYFIITNFTNVSINTSYVSNTVEVIDDNYYIPLGTNIQIQLNQTALLRDEILVEISTENYTVTTGVVNQGITYDKITGEIYIPASLIDNNIVLTANRGYLVTFSSNVGNEPSISKYYLPGQGTTYGSFFEGGALPTVTKAGGVSSNSWRGKNLYNVGTAGNYILDYAHDLSISNGVISGYADSWGTGTGNASFIIKDTYYEYVVGKTFSFSWDILNYPSNNLNRVIIIAYNASYNPLPTELFATGFTAWYHDVQYVSIYNLHLSATYTLNNDNIKYFRMGFNILNNSVQRMSVWNVQLEESSTPTAYEPYIGDITASTTITSQQDHTIIAKWA